jgi:hypothetical protein
MHNYANYSIIYTIAKLQVQLYLQQKENSKDVYHADNKECKM